MKCAIGLILGGALQMMLLLLILLALQNSGACSSLPPSLSPAFKCHWLFGQLSVPAYFQEASHRWMTEASKQQDSDYVTVFRLHRDTVTVLNSSETHCEHICFLFSRS